jgi:hypothetical protein
MSCKLAAPARAVDYQEAQRFLGLLPLSFPISSQFIAFSPRFRIIEGVASATMTIP